MQGDFDWSHGSAEIPVVRFCLQGSRGIVNSLSAPPRYRIEGRRSPMAFWEELGVANCRLRAFRGAEGFLKAGYEGVVEVRVVNRNGAVVKEWSRSSAK